ncbi:nicotinamide riboside transporter PnuC [Lactococcus lactis]|uniref:nicotinamide riboside transporter PnuC n=1 Tax=Lactococcus lactis TaxID=1358 RepID=UPI00109CD68A|nr:nicotinamide riboside transporter PnuC [Lactococcus lactis]MBS7068640.1 nicotinamide riboside transporter PnuC [Lactococcus lactis]MDO6179089.1 nicotinamide riboside transporter PnuC [Lactococcus lactis]MDT2885250.1 nicotinamide riboside transporter PnuC [Lactococcus lactis]MDT2901450.1 nicotinamide riboside transporter PnuC [Lactococcus lactis]MDT2922834.1 nicotinamide riboside transporter PnuC [Lactococcus lactis]
MNKNQFKIFREAIKQTFSIKKIFEELSTLHIQEYLLLFLMTIAQVISFLFTKDASVLVLILSISSIINLVLVDRGRITNYFWGSITTTAWVVIAIHTRLIGDIASQTFYLIMQFLGIYIWGKELRATTKHEVQSKKLTTFQALIYFVGTILLYFMIVIISKKLGGVQIWLDAALFPLAIVGQILMTFGYRSQWVAWNIINIINIIIWYNQFMVNGTSISLSMLMLQIVMFLNSIYGSIIWLKKSKSYTI